MAWTTSDWPNAQQILERLRELAARSSYSPIITIADFAPVGGAGGNTAQGRTTNFVRIGRQGTGSTTPVKVVFIGGMHAREWAPPTAVVNLIEKLCDAWAAGAPLPVGGAPCSAQEVKDIIDKVDLYIAPMMNPDGYEQSRTAGNRMWRKNMRPPPSPMPAGSTCTATDPLRFGVDLNRNFDVLFDPSLHYLPAASAGNQTITDPCEPQQVYGGLTPFSEPETSNVKFLLDKNPHYFVDVHMHGRDIYHAWGTEDNDPISGLTPQLDQTVLRDGHGAPGVKEKINVDFLAEITKITDFMCDATLLASGIHYQSIAGADMGAFGGASDDYATSRNLPSTVGGPQPIRAFTIECGQTFVDTFSGQFPNIQKEVHAALISLLRYATTAQGRAAMDPIGASGGGTSGGAPHGCADCGGCSIAGADTGGDHP